jgi:hypothetical protein
LAATDDPAPFVALAIETFGAIKWLVSDGGTVEEGLDPWLPVGLLCRLFVALLSDFTPPGGWEPLDLIPRTVLH